MKKWSENLDWTKQEECFQGWLSEEAVADWLLEYILYS